MKKRTRRPAAASPMMMAQLGMTAWETILRRTAMMAMGTCSPAEYRRMTAEKAAAMRSSMTAMMMGRGQAAMVAPFLNRTRANVKRLRRKG